MGIWYCTREEVKSSLDVKETARANAQIDRLIEASSRSVEGLTHRKFYPWTGTRYFDWPNRRNSSSWRLWLDQDEVVSVSSLVSGGETIASADYFLEPANDGPPFTHIEIDLASSASFEGGDTHQRNIAVTGVFGESANTEPAGSLAEALDSSETAVDVTDSAAIGIGHIIKVDSERMIVTKKTMLTTGQTLQTDLTASNANDTVAVTTGSAFQIGEMILLDSERMLIVDIASNNLIVKRAWDGSALATHTGSTIYAGRTLTVERGALGTTAATHNTAAEITRHRVPGLVNQLAIAETLTGLQKEGSAYVTRKELEDLRDQVYTTHGRKVRTRAV